MSDLSILIVTSTPDHRDSTTELATIVTELRRRPGARVNVWFLRHGESSPWPGSRVVDDLRTLPLPSVIDKIGLSLVAGVIRGRMLRRWWAEAGPDVVLLDDALGERLIPDDRSGLVVVHRTNPVPPNNAGLETPPTHAADIELVPRDGNPLGGPPEGPPGRIVLTTTPRSDFEPARPFIDAGSRAIVRKRLGLPSEGLLVVGWGEHAWFDGPDMFVRTIWNLRERHGVDAHGLWAGSDEQGEVDAVLADETARCDLSEHLTHLPRSTIDVRLCGDVAFLPYRDDGDLGYVREASITGCPVITFPVWPSKDPLLQTVDHLDLEAAAEAIIEASHLDRATRAATAGGTLDVGPFVDDLLAAVADTRRSR